MPPELLPDCWQKADKSDMSLSVVYGGPEWTLIIKIRNKHYFAGSFPLNFVQIIINLRCSLV